MLDLLDYCQRSLTRLLVKSERGREGKMIESEGSSSEEDDGENLPSKKKILAVLWVWLREGRGRKREREREREHFTYSLSTGTQGTGANTTIQCQYESLVNSQIH